MRARMIARPVRRRPGHRTWRCRGRSAEDRHAHHAVGSERGPRHRYPRRLRTRPRAPRRQARRAGGGRGRGGRPAQARRGGAGRPPSWSSRDEIYLVTGHVFSNVALAMMPTLARAETFLVSPNAGPSALAGKQCNPWFFNTAWQNDNNHEATGACVQAQGFENVYLLAPNYPAGKDALAGFKRYYKGGIAGEVYTLARPDRLRRRAREPPRRTAGRRLLLLPGWPRDQLHQAVRAGRPESGTIPCSARLLVQPGRPGCRGRRRARRRNGNQWSGDLDNPINRRFVDGFKAKYGRLPSLYASQGRPAADPRCGARRRRRWAGGQGRVPRQPAQGEHRDQPGRSVSTTNHSHPGLVCPAGGPAGRRHAPRQANGKVFNDYQPTPTRPMRDEVMEGARRSGSRCT